jgi:hypothetical protein
MADPLLELHAELDRVIERMWDSEMPDDLQDEADQVLEQIAELQDPRSIEPLLKALARGVTFFDMPDPIISALEPHGKALVEPVTKAIDALDPNEPMFKDHFCYLVDLLVHTGQRDAVVMSKVLHLAIIAEPEYAAERIAAFDDPRMVEVLRSMIDTNPVADNEAMIAGIGATLDELEIPLTDDQRKKVTRAKRDLAAAEKPN